jgi:hypothetical protein
MFWGESLQPTSMHHSTQILPFHTFIDKLLYRDFGTLICLEFTNAPKISENPVIEVWRNFDLDVP